MMSLFSEQCQNLCLLSLAFIIDWRVVQALGLGTGPIDLPASILLGKELTGVLLLEAVVGAGPSEDC